MPESDPQVQSKPTRPKGWAVVAIGGLLLVLGAVLVKTFRLAGNTWVRYPPVEVADVKDVHTYKGQPLCQACHLGEDRRLRDAPNALCRSCHPFHAGSHPVDVVQSTPVDLPMGEGNLLLCHTCHDPHDVRANRDGLRLPFNDLCITCHSGH